MYKNILGLFDGMSCGQIALKKVGIKYENYYASEVDYEAIRVGSSNFPNTHYRGDVRQINVRELPKIDLIMFGSPCTDLSRAGKMVGMATTDGIEVESLKQYLKLKKLNKEFVGQSYLFWEALRILNELKEINPDVKFLCENTTMSKKWLDIFNRELGVMGIKMNSSLISAQNRERIYWTNIPNVKPPIDNNVKLTDLIPNAVSAGKRGRDTGKRTVDGKKVWDVMLTYRKDNKSNCLVTNPSRTNLIEVDGKLRTITPEEAEILQTIPKGYTNIKGISNASRFKMIGNGWTIDMISHIFKCGLKEKNGQTRV
jgi:site-specific DNA-cytosine methylase